MQKPYDTRFMNNLGLFNEFLILFYLYLLHLETDYNLNTDAKKTVGWILLALVFIYILVNLAIGLFMSGIEICKVMRRFLRRKEMKRVEKSPIDNGG